MKKKARRSAGNFVWTSYSDLSTGMMMCFILLFMFEIHEITKKDSSIDVLKAKSELVDSSIESIQKIKVEYEKISQFMNENHSSTCDNVRFEPNNTSIRIAFLKEGVWFNDGESNLQESAKICLKKFGPLLLEKTFEIDSKLKKKVSQLIVEGHTNSDPIKNGKDKYLDNLDLSQKRAYETVKFIIENSKSLDSELGRKFEGWRQKTLSANGRSYADLIIKNSKEDKEASKRVEFKAVFNNDFDKITKK
jgi:chemotaxis protein MotB